MKKHSKKAHEEPIEEAPEEDNAPELVRRRANRKSAMRSGRTIGEAREQLETRNERNAARKKDKKKKVKTVYLEDKGETIYSMASLYGRTPEEQEEYNRKSRGVDATGRERLAMIRAAFSVYGPMLLIVVGGFTIAALLMYLFLK